jgi:hypothetical protein
MGVTKPKKTEKSQLRTAAKGKANSQLNLQETLRILAGCLSAYASIFKPEKRAPTRGGQGFDFERWVNIYPTEAGQLTHGYVYDSRERADGEYFKPSRIACVRVLIEGREGDGLKPAGKGKP